MQWISSPGLCTQKEDWTGGGGGGGGVRGDMGDGGAKELYLCMRR